MIARLSDHQVGLWVLFGLAAGVVYSPFISAYTPPAPAQCLYVLWPAVIPQWTHVWRRP